MRQVLRDQAIVWVPASFIGLALPAMLSVEFLPRGTIADTWSLAGLTAGGVQQRVGGALGDFCLGHGAAVRAAGDRAQHDVGGRRLHPPLGRGVVDGRARRCSAGIRTASARCTSPCWRATSLVGIFFLSIARPLWLIVAYGNLGNFVLGVSCWHVLYVNLTLLPPEVRPGWPSRIGLFLGGLYFLSLAVLTLIVAVGWL